jgi:hypothetical protein
MIVKNSNSNFGGINILFCGDFCQLPPVNEEALYKLTRMESQKSGFVCNVCKSCKTKYSNKYKKNPSQYSNEKENGRLLWLQLTHVEILTQQIRQIEDPEFAALLKRLRVGECTDADFKLLNTRFISKNDLGDEWSEVPILVSRNILKMEINKIKIKIFAQKYKKNIYKVNSIDQQKKYNNIKKVADHTNIILKALDGSSTGNLPTQLSLVIGAKYFITSNSATELGLANGIEVILRKIYSSNTKHQCGNGEFEFDEMLYCLIVELIKSTDKKFSNLEKSMVPIFPKTESFELKLYGKKDENSEGLRIKRTQFPLVPAYAYTVHKAQGKTLNKVIGNFNYLIE